MMKFDLVELSDHFDSIALAREIRRQFNLHNEYVPLEDIAAAVGVFKIEERELKSIEGALVVPAGKIDGQILLNSKTYPERKRFTLAHEIGHLVHPLHHPDNKDGRFNCTKDDIFKTYQREGLDIIETQANEFASELLIPEKHIASVGALGQALDFEHIINFAEPLKVSKAATIYKLKGYCTKPTAFIFSRHGKIIRCHTDGFPRIKVWVKSSLPEKSLSYISLKKNSVSKKTEISGNVWLSNVVTQRLFEQVYVQEDGYRITMLILS